MASSRSLFDEELKSRQPSSWVALDYDSPQADQSELPYPPCLLHTCHRFGFGFFFNSIM